jgi:hypothetical protein
MVRTSRWVRAAFNNKLFHIYYSSLLMPTKIKILRLSKDDDSFSALARRMKALLETFALHLSLFNSSEGAYGYLPRNATAFQ